MLEVIVDIIILIGALVLAVERIINFIRKTGKGVKKTVDTVKDRQDEELNKKIDERLKMVLPEILKEHDLETRKKYLNDRERYLQEIKEAVVAQIKERLNAVELHEVQMEIFTEVLKELLRERIMLIYGRNRHRRELEEHEKIELDRSYASYKSINGNSYIDDFYQRMCTWTVIPDDNND